MISELKPIQGFGVFFDGAYAYLLGKPFNDEDPIAISLITLLSQLGYTHRLHADDMRTGNVCAVIQSEVAIAYAYGRAQS